MRTTSLRTNDSDNDIEKLADAVGVLKLGFVATCQCGVVLADPNQIMCTRCARS